MHVWLGCLAGLTTCNLLKTAINLTGFYLLLFPFTDWSTSSCYSSVPQNGVSISNWACQSQLQRGQVQTHDAHDPSVESSSSSCRFTIPCFPLSNWFLRCHVPCTAHACVGQVARPSVGQCNISRHATAAQKGHPVRPPWLKITTAAWLISGRVLS